MVHDITLRQLSDKYIYIVMIMGSLYLCLLAPCSIAVMTCSTHQLLNDTASLPGGVQQLL